MLRIPFQVMKDYEGQVRNIRVVETFPFLLSKQATELGEADGYGLQ